LLDWAEISASPSPTISKFAVVRGFLTYSTVRQGNGSNGRMLPQPLKSKLWSSVPWYSEPRITVLARANSNLAASQ
jgi:hypothetical protein